METAYTVKELAEIMNCPERTLRKRIEEGQLQTCQSKYNSRAPHYITDTFFAEFLANFPQLPEVKKFKIEKAKKMVAKLYESRPGYGKDAQNDKK